MPDGLEQERIQYILFARKKGWYGVASAPNGNSCVSLWNIGWACCVIQANVSRLHESFFAP